MVDLARKMLLHDKTRLLITVIGVSFAVTLVFIQIGLFIGIINNASCTIDHMAADLWVTSKNTPNIDFAHAFPETRVQRVRSVPGVERADNLIVVFVDIALPSGTRESALIYAVEDFEAWNLPWKILEGDVHELRQGRYVFLDDYSTKRFGPFQVGDYREYRGKRLKIIGRSAEALSFTTSPITIMDYHLAQDVDPQQLRAKSSFILVKLQPGADAETVKAAIQERLPFNDVYTKKEWSRKSRAYWIRSTGLGFNMFLTIFLGGLVGLVIVAQTLYASTMEHLREYGTVKAIGGSNGDIYRIIAKQAIFAAIVGYFIGLIPTAIVKPILKQSADLNLVMTPTLGVLIFIGTVLMCLSASMISFHKVASIDPALVFRT